MDKHSIVFGHLGNASKTITFKLHEFKKELAPSNARIEYHKINGENVVTMTYSYRDSNEEHEERDDGKFIFSQEDNEEAMFPNMSSEEREEYRMDRFCNKND